MTTATYDSAYAPAATPRRSWLWRLLFGDEQPRPGPRRTRSPDDIPDFLRRDRAREADGRSIPGQTYVRPTHVDYAPKPEPVAELVPEPPAVIDPLADLKLRLRTLTYGDFMQTIEGMGCDPTTAWKWATA